MAFEPLQSSYLGARTKLIAGMPAFSGSEYPIVSGVMRGLGTAGLACFLHTNGGEAVDSLRQVFQVATPGVAADVDAVKTTTASSASPVAVTITKTQDFAPQRYITFVLNSNANWDATDLVVTYVSDGRTVTETLAIPDGGNTTLTTSQPADHDGISYTMEAQSGTGGSYTVGISAITLSKAKMVGVLRKRSGVYNSASLQALSRYGIDLPSTEYDHLDGDEVAIVAGGSINVITETQMRETDTVYVRIAAGAGGSTLGAFRNTADSGSAVECVGWRVLINSPSATVAPVAIPAWMK